MQKRDERRKSEWSKPIVNTRPFDASIILHNAQRPATVANLRLIDFQDAETMPTGDRVAKVS